MYRINPYEYTFIVQGVLKHSFQRPTWLGLFSSAQILFTRQKRAEKRDKDFHKQSFNQELNIFRKSGRGSIVAKI